MASKSGKNGTFFDFCRFLPFCCHTATHLPHPLLPIYKGFQGCVWQVADGFVKNKKTGLTKVYKSVQQLTEEREGKEQGSDLI